MQTDNLVGHERQAPTYMSPRTQMRVIKMEIVAYVESRLGGLGSP